jgi:hypothetical protein
VSSVPEVADADAAGAEDDEDEDEELREADDDEEEVVGTAEEVGLEDVEDDTDEDALDDDEGVNDKDAEEGRVVPEADAEEEDLDEDADEAEDEAEDEDDLDADEEGATAPTPKAVGFAEAPADLLDDDEDEEDAGAEATLSAGVIPPEAAEDVLDAAGRAAPILAAADDAWASAYDNAEAKMPLKSTDELSSAEFSKLVMSPRRLERNPCPREAAVEGLPPCRRWMVTGEASALDSSAREIVADNFMLGERAGERASGPSRVKLEWLGVAGTWVCRPSTGRSDALVQRDGMG